MPPKKVVRRAPAKAPAAKAPDAPDAPATETQGEPSAPVKTETSAAADAAPAETSGTATKKAPPKRLDTLARPPSIGSPSSAARPTPTPTASSPAPATRGGAAKPKFVGRRSQTQRAELEKAEAARQAAEAAARARKESRAARGRGDGDRGRGRGRARGGFMGEREKPPPPGASGPFSMGIVSADAGRGRVGRSGAGTFFGGGSGGPGGGSGGGGGGGDRHIMRTGGVKQEDGDAGMSLGQMQDGGYISSDDDEQDKGVQRKNVDDLEVVDLTKDDDDPMRNFAPLRIPRHVHKERTLGLNADGAAAVESATKEAAAEVTGDGASRRKGKQRAKDVEITGEKERYHGNWSSSSETEGESKVKEEPADEDGVTAPRASTPDMPSSNIHPPDEPNSPEARRKSRDKRSSISRPKRPEFQTQEEVDEWERHESDLRILHEELGTLVLPSNPPAAPATDADGDANMTSTDAEAPPPTADRRAEKVYLFQFPPVLPDLEQIQVKPDPENPGAEGEAMAVDPPAAPSAPKPASLGHLPNLPTGAVGKLRIHKSGRATLDWGGTPLAVGMGTDSSFLQDVLIADLADTGTKAEGENGEPVVKSEGAGQGTAMGMGQVKGKFVVTPDWESMIAG